MFGDGTKLHEGFALIFEGKFVTSLYIPTDHAVADEEL